MCTAGWHHSLMLFKLKRWHAQFSRATFFWEPITQAALCILVAFKGHTHMAFLKSIDHKLFQLLKNAHIFPAYNYIPPNTGGKVHCTQNLRSLTEDKTIIVPTKDHKKTSQLWNLTGTGFSNSFPKKSHCRWSPIRRPPGARSSGVRFPWCYFKGSFHTD